MKKAIIYIVLGILSFSLQSCGNSSNTSKPSIKDNSINVKQEAVKDYSNVNPKKLLKQVQAHYDLDEYATAKEKLTYLMQNYTDSLGNVNLLELKDKIDVELKKELAKKQEIANLSRNSRLNQSLDKMLTFSEGKFTVYKDKTSPKFDTKECFFAYIKKDAYGPKLYFKIRYIDTQWLNIENFIVTVDQLDQTIEGEIVKSETKGKKKYKIELLDKEITSPEDLEIINTIANGDNVVALYVGNNTYKKRDISQEQLTAIRNVLDAYAFMNAKKNIELESNMTSNDTID